MARRTICSCSETSNEIISIKVLQKAIKSSCAKVIRIYEAGGTGCLMEQTKTKKFHTAKLSAFFNNLHVAICYSQELSKNMCAIFSMRSCPGRVLTVGIGLHFFGFTNDCVHDGVLLSHTYLLHMLENENFK